MASGFSANQYDSAFKSHRLQNWSETKHFKERPTAQVGYTSFIADNRGHLLPGVKKGRSWPDFKGTWDLPAHIRHLNPTACSAQGLQLSGQNAKPLRGNMSTDVNKQTSKEVWQDAMDHSAAASRPESQTSSERNTPVLHAEQNTPTPRNKLLPSQSSTQEVHPVSPPTGDRETQHRLLTREERPQSNTSVKTAETSSSRKTNRDIQEDQ